MIRIGMTLATWLLVSSMAAAAGPWGGNVNRVLTTPSGEALTWAGTEHGLYRFAGGSWQRVAELGLDRVQYLVRCAGAVYAFVPGSGLYVRERGAEDWQLRSLAELDRRGRTPALSGLDSAGGVLYAGVAARGPYRSEDGGRTWDALDAGLEGLPPPALHATAFLGGDGARPLLMATDGAGVFAWRDGRWQSSAQGLPPGTRGVALAADPWEPRHLVLATYRSGVWDSVDGGASWTLLTRGRFGVTAGAAFDGSGALLAHFTGQGLFHLREGKARWFQELARADVAGLTARKSGGWVLALAHDGILEVGADGTVATAPLAGLAATRVLALAPGAEPDQVWCGDSNGVFFSADRGASWEARDVGLLGTPVNGFLWRQGALYLASAGQGVFRWSPDARRWEPRIGGMGTANTVVSLVLDADGSILYAGTEGGVLRSEDGGASWQHLTEHLPPGSRWELAASPTVSGRVWAAGPAAVYRSEDRGQTWEEVLPQRVLAVAAAGEEELWVLESSRLGHLSSGGNLQTRLEVRSGERFTDVRVLDERVWVAGSAGLWVSAGENFLPVETPAGVLSVLPREEAEVLVGSDGLGVVAVEFPAGLPRP